jgi:hypothetical protein
MVARPPRQVKIAVSRHPAGPSLRFFNHIIGTRRVNESGDLQFTWDKVLQLLPFARKDSQGKDNSPKISLSPSGATGRFERFHPSPLDLAVPTMFLLKTAN